MFLLLLCLKNVHSAGAVKPRKQVRPKVESNYCGYSINTCAMYLWSYGWMPTCCEAYMNSGQLNALENSEDETPRRIQRAAKGFRTENDQDFVNARSLDDMIKSVEASRSGTGGGSTKDGAQPISARNGLAREARPVRAFE